MLLPLLNNISTHSSDSCYQECNWRYYLAYHLGVRPKKPAQPFRQGGAFHSGLDAKAAGMSQDDAISIAIQPYEELPAWVQTEEHLYDWSIEREIVARLLSGYFWYWQNDGITVLATEQSFNLPIYNPATGRPIRRRQAGKKDKIVRMPDSRVLLMEHKTTGDSIAPDSDYWLPLSKDFQISRYFKAATASGYRVEGVLYDVIHKPDIAPRQVPLLDEHGLKVVLDANGNRVMLKNGKPRQSGDKEQGWTLQVRRETADEFGTRLTDDIAARPEVYFARREIPRLQSDLDRFAADLYAVQMQIRDSIKHNRWPRNVRACRNPYPCPYMRVCDHNFNESLPDGFEQVLDPHPELGGSNVHSNSRSAGGKTGTTEDATDACCAASR